MTRIKLCGMRQAIDVDQAVALGVDAVGFVLWPGSPRHVAAEIAHGLVRRLPPFVTPVAVMVSPTRDEIARALDTIGCHVVQVHGPVDDEVLVFDAGRVLCAVSLGAADGDVVPAVAEGRPVLLDAHDPERHGGTGRAIDWPRAARVAARRRVMLAGGLTPANVGEAIRIVRPYGVDVASGVERSPGVKDHQAMRAFVAAVRTASQVGSPTRETEKIGREKR